MKEKYIGRTWIEVDLDTIIRNYREALSMCRPGTDVVSVIKSNAYGHGARAVAKALYEAGCRSFAVSCIREALELRQSGLEGDLLVMGLCEPNWIEKALSKGIILTVADVKNAQAISCIAGKQGLRARIHLKVDTGMHRLGFDPWDQEGMTQVFNLPNLALEGVYSHLSLLGKEQDEKQHSYLMQAVEILRQAGADKLKVHLCDSIGMVRYPQWHYDQVRTGAMLFGVRPMHSEHLPFKCEEALVFKTTVAQLHDVKEGDTVGYEDDLPMTRDSRIATLCVGYGDGYPRSMTNVGQVEIRGKRAPVCGVVCMDQMMVDVTDIPDVQVGDEVTLLGGGISYHDYVDWSGGIRNEAITILSRRPIRVYYRNDRIVYEEDLILGDED